MNFPKITLKTKFPSQMLSQSPKESLPPIWPRLRRRRRREWWSSGSARLCLSVVRNQTKHKGLGLRKVLKKVLKKALKKILLTQKRTQKSKCTFLSTQKSTQKFNFSECWVQKFTQKRSPKEILLKKVIYCPKLYSKKWTVFIPTYKYRWWHYPLVG